MGWRAPTPSTPSSIPLPQRFAVLDVETIPLAPLGAKGRQWPYRPTSHSERPGERPGGPRHRPGRHPAPMPSPIGDDAPKPPRCIASSGNTWIPAAPKARYLPRPGQRGRPHGRWRTGPRRKGVPELSDMRDLSPRPTRARAPVGPLRAQTSPALPPSQTPDRQRRSSYPPSGPSGYPEGSVSQGSVLSLARRRQFPAPLRFVPEPPLSLPSVCGRWPLREGPG